MMLSPTLTANDFFAAAYEALGGKADISPNDLHERAARMYWRWRDKTIEAWATTVYDRHGESLIPLYDTLLDMVQSVDEAYYIGAVSSCVWADDDTSAEALAHVVAVIRWYSNVRAERVNESLRATAEDAAQWLEQYGFAPVKAGQMSLFLGI